MALKGVIKPMPQYSTHIRAGVCFPSEGREFVVDPSLFDEAAKEARALVDEAHRAGAVGFESPDKPVVFHVADPSPFNRNHMTEKRGRLIDLPGKPLILDENAYEYLRQAFGMHLSCEPVGGVPDPMVAQARAAALEAENARLKQRIAELMAPAAASPPSKPEAKKSAEK